MRQVIYNVSHTRTLSIAILVVNRTYTKTLQSSNVIFEVVYVPIIPSVTASRTLYYITYIIYAILYVVDFIIL